MIAIFFLLWLLLSLLTMGVVCIMAALIFRVFPNQFSHRLMWSIYVLWARMLGWWVRCLVPDITVSGELIEDRSFVLVANHYCWLDVLVLYAVMFSQRMPFVFVMKRSLLWLPIIGWVCWGVGHPLVFRGKGWRQNKLILEKGALLAKHHDYGVAIFPEGTRYVSLAHGVQGLLGPKSAGYECILQKMGEAPIVDVTLVYQKEAPNVWDFLFRRVGSIVVEGQVYDAQVPLSSIWANKQKRLSQIQKQWQGIDLPSE